MLALSRVTVVPVIWGANVFTPFVTALSRILLTMTTATIATAIKTPTETSNFEFAEAMDRRLKDPRWFSSLVGRVDMLTAT